MALTKAVKLEIHSTIEDIGPDGWAEAETVCETADAVLTSEAGSTTLRYKTEGEGGKVVSAFVLKDNGALTVRRQGAISSVLEFKAGTVYKTLYEIAPYKFDVTVKTEKLDGGFTLPKSELELIYTMDIGGAARRTRMLLRMREVEV
jgi:uncharacterized beta-barrel protein YwiB (DUF1934 family)